VNWILIAEIIYTCIVAVVCLRIIYDTTSTAKTLSYLLLSIFVPIAGMVFYFSFGINYRKRKIYSKKLIKDDILRKEVQTRIISYTEENLRNSTDSIRDAKGLVHLLLNDSWSPLTAGNYVKLLFNGEEKFPELLAALRSAKHHIHIQYYIYEDDSIGNQIKDILILKAREGVQVRFIYDDFGSRSIRSEFVKQLKDAGVEAYPFNRILYLFLANRVNYRNHRKIVVVDGGISFVGGMNVSDRYINKAGNENEFYWRDTHLRIDGTGCQYLQYLFFCDWNFCAGQQLQPDPIYFNGHHQKGFNSKVQVAASGPDSPTATIMLSLLKAINLAKEEILITTPYFIPGESILDALKVASISGVTVKILVPGISDSRLVNAAAWSYYDDLLKSGVQIFLYQKGFIHSKTVVIDGYLSIVGTANMDYRSFDLNFEVNVVVYDEAIGAQLIKSFDDDLTEAEEINLDSWRTRPFYKRFAERIARLLSPML
jgi:cardiolipin synthase